MIENICALEKLKKLKDNSQDIIYADAPYALGSTVLIGKDGKPYYKEAKDFMDKWEMPDEKFWEEYMLEAHRVLKHGGRMLLFGIDRQLMLFQYYAVAANLEIKQSLYWYFISNFPKATDLSNQINKRLGVDIPKGELISENTAMGGATTPDQTGGYPETELAKKYEGFKYSISPLKQVLETVMVFQKATKNKSVLDDVFAYEEGDKTISPSIWAIDDGRVPTNQSLNGGAGITGSVVKMEGFDRPWIHDPIKVEAHKQKTIKSIEKAEELGRFPSQLFVCKKSADKLDEQSGELSSGARKSSYKRNNASSNPNETYGKFQDNQMDDAEKDTGGASRILHHIGYLDEELDLCFYSPKVSTFEREHGCDGFEKQEKVFNDTSGESSVDIKGVEEKFTTAPTKNSHPTLKPIKLNYNIAKLLKAPFPQNVCFPFAAARSEVIGFEQADFDPELFEGSEISEEFNNIGIARQKAWKDLDINNLESSKKHIEKRKEDHKSQGSLF